MVDFPTLMVRLPTPIVDFLTLILIGNRVWEIDHRGREIDKSKAY